MQQDPQVSASPVGGGRPTVSVIIPAYRAARTIERAVDSLLRQSVPPDEILVVDDGSPDDLAAAVAPYGARVRLVRQANGGAASARNRGLDLVRGDLIAFLDADDYWEPFKLERQLEVLRRHPEVGLTASRSFYESPGGARRPPYPNQYPEMYDRAVQGQGAAALRLATLIWTSSVVLRREVLGKNRFDTTLRTAEDVDLWIRLALAAPVYIFSEPLATAVLLQDSLSRASAEADFPNMLRVIRRYASLLGRRGVRWWEIRVHRDWAAGHLARGEPRAALAPAGRRLRLEPWSLQAWWVLLKALFWSCSPFGMYLGRWAAPEAAGHQTLRTQEK